jgi:hypothetical protein
VRWSAILGAAPPDQVLRAAGPAVVSAAAASETAVTVESDGTVTWWSPTGGALGSTRAAGTIAPVQQIVCIDSLVVVAHAAGVTAVNPSTSRGDGSSTSGLAVSPDGEHVTAIVDGRRVDVAMSTGEVIHVDSVAGDRVNLVGLADGTLVTLTPDGELTVEPRSVPATPSPSRVAPQQQEPASGRSVDPVTSPADPVGYRGWRAPGKLTWIAGDAQSRELLVVQDDGSVYSVPRTDPGSRLCEPGAPVTAIAPDGRGGAVVARADGSIEFATVEHLRRHALGIVFSNIALHPRPTDPNAPNARPSAVPSAPSDLVPPDAVGVTADGALWRIDGDGRCTPLGRHGATVTGLCFSQPAVGDDRRRRPTVVSAGADGVIRAWDTITGRCAGAVVAAEPFVDLAAVGDRVVARTARGELWVLRCTPPTWAHLPDIETFVTESPSPLDDAAHELDITLSSNVPFVVDVLDIAVSGLREPYSLRDVRLLEITANIPMPLREPVRVGDLDIAASVTIDGPRGDVPGRFQLEVTLSSPSLGGADVVSLDVGHIEESYRGSSTA